jgi:hypothetical protein
MAGTDTISFVYKDNTCSPKYRFFPGLGYARDSAQANLKCGKIIQQCHEYGPATSSPTRRLTYGRNMIETLQERDKHTTTVREVNKSIAYALRQLSNDNNRIRKRVSVGQARGVHSFGMERVEGCGVDTMAFKSRFNLDANDDIKMATGLRWCEQFMSYKWMKALICKGGAGNNVKMDSDSEDDDPIGAPTGEDVDRGADDHRWWETGGRGAEEGEENNTAHAQRRNRRAAPGTEYAKRQCFDLVRFQHLNKLETLAQNLKMCEMSKYAQIMFVILKTRIDMDYLTFGECEDLFKWLINYSVFVTLVQRRMGKTVSHVANACMETVMFPMAGHMNLYVTASGRLTTAAYDTMTSNIPEMLEEFNMREKLNFLNMKQQRRGGQHHHQSNGQRNKYGKKAKCDMTFTDFYLQGDILKDTKRTALAVCFKRYVLDGSCLDKRPYCTNLFRCLIIKDRAVSTHETYTFFPLLNLFPLS